MKVLILILALLLQHSVFSQSATNDSIRKQDRSDAQNITQGDDDVIFMKCEIEPSIDTYIWKRHQDKQIKEFLKASKEKQKIPSGIYRIRVVFLVEKNGIISDVQIMNDPGFGLGELAKTICKTSLKWKPGKQNSHIVRAYKTGVIELEVLD